MQPGPQVASSRAKGGGVSSSQTAVESWESLGTVDSPFWKSTQHSLFTFWHALPQQQPHSLRPFVLCTNSRPLLAYLRRGADPTCRTGSPRPAPCAWSLFANCGRVWLLFPLCMRPALLFSACRPLFQIPKLPRPVFCNIVFKSPPWIPTLTRSWTTSGPTRLTATLQRWYVPTLRCALPFGSHGLVPTTRHGVANSRCFRPGGPPTDSFAEAQGQGASQEAGRCESRQDDPNNPQAGREKAAKTRERR